eukprot:3444690-Lingulodinium_polyedra.AAC.1
MSAIGETMFAQLLGRCTAGAGNLGGCLMNTNTERDAQRWMVEAAVAAAVVVVLAAIADGNSDIGGGDGDAG